MLDTRRIYKTRRQQNLLVGQSKALPKDRLSHNVYSSDTSVVDIKDGKLMAKGAGIAIVYRYDETYCDAFKTKGYFYVEL